MGEASERWFPVVELLKRCCCWESLTASASVEINLLVFF